MKLILPALIATALAATLPSSAEEAGFTQLFDGKTLNGWQSARVLAGEETAFFVNREEKALHTYAGCEAGSAQESDCLITDKEYSHFILKLEYKWLDNRFAPRTDWDRDAGLLFHVRGDLKKIWPLSFEMQIGESPADKQNRPAPNGRFHTGDLFVLGKGLHTHTPKNGNTYAKDGKIQQGTHVDTVLGKEKPMGEWNEMEIHVHGSEKATFILNGEVVLETFQFTHKNHNGETVPFDKGRIGLQAEWAELLYRNIRVKELTKD